jgi:hypothetical protein
MKTEPVPVELPDAVIAAAATVKATTLMVTANTLMRMLRRTMTPSIGPIPGHTVMRNSRGVQRG